MGYYLNFDNTESVSLASVTGWGDIRRYAKRLPLSDFGIFVQFVEWGVTQELEKLESEAKLLLSTRPPGSKETSQTLSDFVSAMENRPEKCIIVYVTDGTTAE